MAKNFTYKKNVTTKMVIKGDYDADTGIISNDEGDFNIMDKLRVFEGSSVEISVTVKSEEDLDG